MNTEDLNGRLDEFKEKITLIFKDTDCEKVINEVLKKSPDDVLTEIISSGLCGRGGAGFPTGIKWKGAAEAKGDMKYIICNADEGEPGTFKDRKILDEQPDKVIAGMIICAHTIGAREGYIYLRGEYTFLLKNLISRCEHWNNLLKGMNVDFTLFMRSGAGAYVCGEETALIESMEGKRGEPRNKPPLPVTSGYKGCPTVINNVETLAYAVMIISDGAENFKSMGIKDSKGGKVFSISGDSPRKGVYELPLGMTLLEFVEFFGDGDTKAVQVGGSSGTCVPRKHFADTIIGFEGVPTGGSMTLFNSSRSMYHVLRNYLEFFQEESCGQCTPCRVGCQQLLKGIEAIRSGDRPHSYLERLRGLAVTMSLASKCSLGQSLVNPFNSITEHFREEVCY